MYPKWNVNPWLRKYSAYIRMLIQVWFKPNVGQSFKGIFKKEGLEGLGQVFWGGELGSKYALKYRTSFGFFLFGFIILSFLIRLHYWFTIFIFLNCHFFLFFGWHIRFRFVGTIVLYTAYTVLITVTFVLIFVLIKSILLFKKFFLLVFTINFLIASQKSWYYWISP